MSQEDALIVAAKDEWGVGFPSGRLSDTAEWPDVWRRRNVLLEAPLASGRR